MLKNFQPDTPPSHKMDSTARNDSIPVGLQIKKLKKGTMNTAIEVRNLELPNNIGGKNKEIMLKELQDLRDMLEELYAKNIKLDEENLCLKKEVKDMKGQIGNVLETMKMLKEDLKKAHEILKQPRIKAKTVLKKDRLMEDLKRRVKELVPEDKYVELDRVFNTWIASLKIHAISNAEEEEKGKSNNCLKEEKQPEKIPLKLQVDALKKQIGKFKEKMKVYKESDSSSTELAFQNVKEEIGKVKEEISKLRLKFSYDNTDGRRSENTELIQKLDEVKQFLEKLK